MTTPQPSFVKLAWPAVVLIVAIVAGLVCLYALAPNDSKPPIGALYVGIPTVVASLATYVQSRRNAQLVEQHGVTISKIDQQTNGALDSRIVQAVGQAIDVRPQLFTEAAIARGLNAVLEKHLEGVQTTAGEPATVSTVTTITPAGDPPQPPAQPA